MVKFPFLSEPIFFHRLFVLCDDDDIGSACCAQGWVQGFLRLVSSMCTAKLSVIHGAFKWLKNGNPLLVSIQSRFYHILLWNAPYVR